MNLYEETIMSLSTEQYDRYAELRKGGTSCVDALIEIEEIQ